MQRTSLRFLWLSVGLLLLALAWMQSQGMFAVAQQPAPAGQPSSAPGESEPGKPDSSDPPAGNPTPGETQPPVDPPTGEVSGDASGDGSASAQSPASASPTGDANDDYFATVVKPLIALVVGIGVVLGLIIVLRVNAFIALISAAIVVSLMAPGDVAGKIGRVASAFGSTAGGIGIVIALAAVIGKCMLDSGAADRIVRAFVRVLGEKQAPVALMGSGYVLAIPVFFDTVFYLLVPLARSLHRQTGKQYLKYILAIGAGGAITHSLVPPTPGPLLMASTLGVDLGLMIMIGALVAAPAAIAGVLFADVADRLMKTPMRSLGNEKEPKSLPDEKLPPLAVAVLPVLLPVLLISTNTILTTLADLEPTARITVESVPNWPAFQQQLQKGAMGDSAPGARRLWEVLPSEARELLATSGSLTEAQQQEVVDAMNNVQLMRDFYDEPSFVGVALSGETKSLLSQDRTRMRQAVLIRMNRLLLEDSLNAGGTTLLAPHEWLTTRRQLANISDLFGNANLALLVSTVIALLMLAVQRGLTRNEVANVVETSLMSGGVIILITAGGGAFGAMLQAARIGDAIQTLFGGLVGGGGGGLAFLLLGFLLASVLKVAQGSGTVSMIVGSSMMAAIVTPGELGFHPVYLAMAIGAGSMVGSWMNDSGFWIFAKMGGLTETEALKSWTLMLVVLGIVSLLVTIVLAMLLPFNIAT